jgi:quercetin dioxygenase-like cupin family protein
MLLDTETCYRQHNLFDGTGEVRVWDLLQQSQLAPFAAVLYCELEAFGRVGPHRQQEHPELVLCLEGNGKATVGAAVHEMAPGSVAALPFGEILAIENQGAEALRYLIIKAVSPTD